MLSVVDLFERTGGGDDILGVVLRIVDDAPEAAKKRVGGTMWSRRRVDEAPLPRAAEGRRTRGVHQAAADEAPLSNAGAFFFLPAQQIMSQMCFRFLPARESCVCHLSNLYVFLISKTLCDFGLWS